MKRETYSKILPIGIVLLILSGFILPVIFPGLTLQGMWIYALSAAVLLIIIDRLSVRKVAESLGDERTRSLAEKAMFVSFRILTPLIFIFGFFVMNVFPDFTELKFIGMGAVLTVSILSGVFGLSYALLARKG